MNQELIPYLTFENTKDALEYYKLVFGATDVFRESPTAKQAAEMAFNDDVDLDSMTMSAHFKIFGKEIWCADSFLGKPVVSSLISLMFKVDLDDSDAVTEMENLYKRTVESEEVKVIVTLEKKSSGNRYGQIVDKYGITWIFNAIRND
ncbi:VOC family protein [Lentilactobacillus sp. SPB1-3]|uniref:VOC family protein n=1 Tax=Lentilactobacillus terminaliae TaxID=3003483 RepID=A0ACD5DG19_9LACO|nr:VOC family protein [Lentilactobacillus sp. SPB1-3]MCZ0976518.1 VOC family protein [Lentilactobacillus sp. SPB1-3]